MSETTRKQIFNFYCRVRGKSGGPEQRIGLEITEAEKPLQEAYKSAEGRVVLRFFNTCLSKDTQVRYTCEPSEAFEIYTKIIRVSRASAAHQEKLPPHKFTRDGKDTLTSILVEKWVNGTKSGYSISVFRAGAGHSVSLKEANLLYLGEILKQLSVSASFQMIPTTQTPPPAAPHQGNQAAAPALTPREQATAALTTLKRILDSDPRAMPLLRELNAMCGPASAK